MGKDRKGTNAKISIALLMPALNEEEVIGNTLQKIPLEEIDIVDNYEIIVIDNGSTDDTPKIAKEHSATVIVEQRMGYGSACLAGIEYLKSKNKSPDFVVFLDADGTDDPKSLRKLLNAKLAKPQPDLVMGRRVNPRKSGMAVHAQIANQVFTRMIQLLYRVDLKDMGPFRIIEYDTLLSLNMQDQGYGWSAEMIVKLLKNEKIIREVDIPQNPRIGKSKISGSFFTSLKAAIWLTIHIIRHSI